MIMVLKRGNNVVNNVPQVAIDEEINEEKSYSNVLNVKVNKKPGIPNRIPSESDDRINQGILEEEHKDFKFNTASNFIPTPTTKNSAENALGAYGLSDKDFEEEETSAPKIVDKYSNINKKDAGILYKNSVPVDNVKAGDVKSEDVETKDEISIEEKYADLANPEDYDSVQKIQRRKNIEQY